MNNRIRAVLHRMDRDGIGINDFNKRLNNLRCAKESYMKDQYPHSDRVPVYEKVGYALGDTATNLTWRTFMVFLPFFYTDVFGLTPASVALLLLICRFWDGITDMIMGVIADRTQTRWGKFRPWVLATALPFGILTILTFSTPDLSPNGKLIYAYVTYSLVIVVFTANNVPYSALMGVMSPNPKERTSISSYRFVFAFIGGLMIQGGLIHLVAFWGKGDDVKGYKIAMTFFAVLLVVFLVITFFTTRERVCPPKPAKGSLKLDLGDLVSNKPWWMLFACGILFLTMAAVRQGSILYYFNYFLDGKDAVSTFMVICTVTSIFGALSCRLIADRLGKKWTLLGSLMVTGLACLALLFVNKQQMVLVYGFSMIAEFAGGVTPVMIFAMLADAADYSEWKNGRRATALVYSVGTLSFKFGSGLGGAITAWVLAWVGYQADVPKSEMVLDGIRWLVSGIPGVIAIAAAVVLFFYKLDDATLGRISEDLKARRAG